MILLHDYNNERFHGARQAVEEFENNTAACVSFPYATFMEAR